MDKDVTLPLWALILILILCGFSMYVAIFRGDLFYAAKHGGQPPPSPVSTPQLSN